MIRNARFWEYINEDYVKITLRPEQMLEWSISGPTDEGWAWEYHSWSHEGSCIKHECDTAARDCDGRFDQNTKSQTSVTKLVDHAAYQEPLDHVGNVIMLPSWEPVTSSQRDYTAEAAGY